MIENTVNYVDECGFHTKDILVEIKGENCKKSRKEMINSYEETMRHFEILMVLW